MKFLVEVDVTAEKLVQAARGDPRAADNELPETPGDIIALLYHEFYWLAEIGVAALEIIEKPNVLTGWIAEDVHISAAQSGHWCTNEEAERLLDEASSQILDGMAEAIRAIPDDLVYQQFWKRNSTSFPKVCPNCRDRETHATDCPYDLLEEPTTNSLLYIVPSHRSIDPIQKTKTQSNRR